MIARGLTMAVLVALVMAGTANAQAAKSDDGARPPDATTPRDGATATTTDADASDALATATPTPSTVADLTVTDPATTDPGLPNAPQPKRWLLGTRNLRKR